MFDYSHDLPFIEAYNNRRSKGSATRLQTHMPVAPFDGDPHLAKIILLMNNPGFEPKVSKPEDHLLEFDGWPLAGLHPDAPVEFRNWYNRPLGKLIASYGAQRVSQYVCILQLCPWASEKFDASLVLPSRAEQVRLAIAGSQRGAVVIVGRSFGCWPSELPRVRNRRNPTLAPGGLDENIWKLVQRAMES